MANIQYTINGSYAPFGVELRLGVDKSGTLVQSTVHESGGTYQFTGVTTLGTYVVIVYDTVGGVELSSPIAITTTTTTTTTTTITTTTAAPTTTTTTTTTTTIPPTTVAFGFINTNVNYYTSSNNGNSWTKNTSNYGGLNNSLPSSDVMLSNAIIVIGRDSSDGGKVLYTTDTGTTWHIGVGFTGSSSMPFLSGNQGTSTVFASQRTSVGVQDRLWKSTDYGVNWNLTVQPSASNSDIAAISSYNNSVVAYYFQASKILGSNDGGVTWSDITPPAGSFSMESGGIDLVDANTIICTVFTGKTVVFKSTNFGSSWTKIFEISGSFQRQHFRTENVGMLLESPLNRVAVTDDGFATHNLVNITGITATTFTSSVKPYVLNLNEFWTIGRDSSVNRTIIFHTKNAGVSWSKQLLAQNHTVGRINFTT